MFYLMMHTTQLQKELHIATSFIQDISECHVPAGFVTYFCSSIIDRSLMMQRVIGSMPHGRLIEQFLFPASASPQA